jgi:hypothetical protein
MFETEPPPAAGRWARLRNLLWQPPRPHGAQPRARTVSPLELFYDLVVVVLVGQAGHHLADHLTWAGLGEFVAVFTLIWIAWFNGTLLHDSTSWTRGSADARVFRRCSRRWFCRWFVDASISSA